MTAPFPLWIALLIVILSELIGLVWQFAEKGLSGYRFYTVDSNFFLLLAAAVLFIGHKTPVLWQWTLFFSAVSCTTLTFLVVLFMLGPHDGYRKHFSGSSLFLHLIAPLAGIGVLLFCVPSDMLRYSAVLFALLPTLLYAVVHIFLVWKKDEKPPYFFLNIKELPFWKSCLWFVVVFGINALSAFGLLLLK